MWKVAGLAYTPGREVEMVETDSEMAWLPQALNVLMARHRFGGAADYPGGLAQAGHAHAQDAGGHRASGPGVGELPKGTQADRLDETAPVVEQPKIQVSDLAERLKKQEGQQNAVAPVNKAVEAPDTGPSLRRWVPGLFDVGRS